MKVCTKCGIEKALEEFYKRSDRKCGIYPRCKQCNKEEERRSWASRRHKAIEYKQADVHRRLLNCAKTSAKSLNREFDLTLEDIVVPEVCPYLGIPLTNHQGRGYCPTNASIDRINSKGGYTKGNVQIMSRRANTMKNDSSIQELIMFAQNVLRLHSQNNDTLTPNN